MSHEAKETCYQGRNPKVTTVLVIGSNSFSGSHFAAEALRKGFQVLGVSRSNEESRIFLPYKWGGCSEKDFSFHRIDLNKDLETLIDLVKGVRPEYIVNFAGQGMVAQSWDNPVHWYRTNLLSQVALHEELRKMKHIKKYIHFTTPEVYGSSNNKLVKEGAEFNPTTPYAVSRAACDMHLASFHKAYDFPVLFTRAANVYGPGQQLYRIIPRAILSARTGKKMKLHGGGKSERSFIHISDVSKALLLLCSEAPGGSTWHISTERWISIYSLVQLICELCGVGMDKVCTPEEETLGKDQDYRLDSSKLRETLGWSDLVSLESGIKQVISWIDSNFEDLRDRPWSYTHKE